MILGAIGSKRVFKRVAEWGDGWMPAGYPPDIVAEGISAIHQFGAEVGRDTRSLDFTVFAGRGLHTSREDIDRVAQAGVNRVILWLNEGDLETTLAQLEGFARDLLD